MWSWFTFWLLLHILIAIAAFGPTFAFPVITRFAQRDPKNALVVSEIVETITSRVTVPGAVLMPFVGLALIYTAHVDLWKSEWLIIAIVLYTILFFFAVLVQGRNGRAMIQAIRAMPAPQPGQGGPPSGGPPPQIAALAKKLQLGGIFLSLLLITIIVLMVWKPGAAFV